MKIKSIGGRASLLFAVGLPLALAAIPVKAGLTSLNMSMNAESKACLVGCTLNANYTTSLDSEASPFGTFGNLTVNSGVTGPFEATASGSTTITSDTSFSVRFDTRRPVVAAETISYSTRSSLDFFFTTDASGGTFVVNYQVQYARPDIGAFLDVGLGFLSPTPFLFSSSNSKSVLVPFDSLVGTQGGTWSATLDPETSYGVQLAAGNTRSIFQAGGVAEDTLGVTFNVTLPSFAQPVPEPGEWTLMLAGLGLIGAVAARRRS